MDRTKWAKWFVQGWIPVLGLTSGIFLAYELFGQVTHMLGIPFYPTLSEVIVTLVPMRVLMPATLLIGLGATAFFCWHWWDLSQRITCDNYGVVSLTPSNRLPRTAAVTAVQIGRKEYAVVPQVNGNPIYVAPSKNKVTAFGLAARYGCTGLLVKWWDDAGKEIAALQPGNIIRVHRDGELRAQRYRVFAIERWKAEQPYNPYSDFAGPNGERLSCTSLFMRIYTAAGRLAIQTCASMERERIFVLAEPIAWNPPTPRAQAPARTVDTGAPDEVSARW